MSVDSLFRKPSGGLRCLCAAVVIVAALTYGGTASGHPEAARASAPGSGSAPAPGAVSIPVQVSHDRYPIHAEPDVAVNPRNPHNVLAVAQCVRLPSSTVAGARVPCTFVSFNGGATWRNNGPLRLRPGDITGADTTVAFSAQGIGFVAAAVGGQSEDYAVVVWRTDNGGRSFARPVTIYQPSPGWSSDHPWLAVDSTPGPTTSSVYVSWVAGQSANWSTSARLLFSRSVDGGHSFAIPRPIVRLTHAYPHVPVLTVGPGGVIHVVYYVIDREHGAAATPLGVVSSSDGGRTFGAQHTIGSTPLALTSSRLPMRNPLAAATDPRDGTLYVVAGGYYRGMQHAAILLWRSGNGGQTWTGPTPIDQVPSIGPADAFQPRIAVTPRGTVYVSYFAYARGRVDVVLAESSTHGASFSPGQRITPAPFDPFSLANPWLGDYQGLAVGAGTIHPFWNGTTRSGHMELFTAAVPGD